MMENSVRPSTDSNEPAILQTSCGTVERCAEVLKFTVDPRFNLTRLLAQQASTTIAPLFGSGQVTLFLIDIGRRLLFGANAEFLDELEKHLPRTSRMRAIAVVCASRSHVVANRVLNATTALDFRLFTSHPAAERWLHEIARKSTKSSYREIRTATCVLGLEDEELVTIRHQKGAVIDLAEAEALISAAKGFFPKKTAMLVDFSGLKSISWEARELFRDNILNERISKCAFVSPSIATVAIGSIFVGMRRSAYPVRIFRRESQAREWLEKPVAKLYTLPPAPQRSGEGLLPEQTVVTRVSILTLRSDGVLTSRVKPLRQSLTDAQEVIAAAKALATDRPRPFLLDLREAKETGREARAFYSLPGSLEFCERIAVIVGSRFTKVMGNSALFMFRKSSQVPMKIFDREEDALHWLKASMSPAPGQRLFASVISESLHLKRAEAEELLSAIARLASQDFVARVNFDAADDAFAAIGSAINMLGEELEHSVLTRERFRQIINAAPAIFYSRRIDEKFSFSFVGENARSLGLDPKLLSTISALWIELIHDEDREAFQRSFLQLKESDSLIYRVRNSKGNYVWVRDSRKVIFDADKRPQEIIGFIFDIDVEQQANMKAKFFHSLLDTTAALAFTDSKGVITDVNENFCRDSGYDRSELIGATHRIVSSGVHGPEFYLNLWNTIQSGEIWHGEIVNKRRDGTLFWLESTIAPMTGSRGNIEGFLVIHHNISARKEAESKLIHSMKMATLGEMSAGIAHEINNPLMIIGGKCRLLARRLEQGEELDVKLVQEELRKVVATTERIEKIVRGLKAFSRTADQDPFENLAIDAIIEDSMVLCREMIQAAGVELRIKPAPGVQVRGRTAQLSQVIVNLVGNAIDAMSTLPEKWIEVAVVKTPQGGACIRIIDAGSGIPPAVLAKIMMPFFTTKEVGKGTGLGLSISKGIIEDHGGRLYVDTQVANTCFVIELPPERET